MGIIRYCTQLPASLETIISKLRSRRRELSQASSGGRKYLEPRVLMPQRRIRATILALERQRSLDHETPSSLKSPHGRAWWFQR